MPDPSLIGNDPMPKRVSATIRRLGTGLARTVLILGLATWVTACQPDQQHSIAAPDAPMGEDEVARSGVLSVSKADLDSYVLRHLRQERPAPGSDLAQWYRDRVREYLLDAALLQTARQQKRHLDQAFTESRSAVVRQTQTEMCIRARISQLPAIERSDLEAEFERNIERFTRPERRLTLHYYRRASGADAIHAATTELESLRERILQGEDFSRLARAGSDSESRHRGGELGWLARGELASEMDQLVFSLVEGVPSTPLVTSNGVHLFLVQSVLPARTATLIEVLPTLRESLVLKWLEPDLQALLSADQADFGMPADAQALAALMRSGDESQLLLSQGEYRLEVGAFRQLLAAQAQRRAANAGPMPADAWTLLRAIRNRERLRQACMREDWIEDAAVDQAVNAWESDRLVELQRREELRALAEADEERLRLYHSQNPDQFSTPMRWSLRRLRISLDGDADATMAALERAHQSRAGDLDQLHSRLGGDIDSLPNQQAADLRRIAPTLPALIAPLQVGQLSPPVRTRQHLQIFQLQSVERPSAADFDSARDQVVSNFVRQHAADLYRQFGDAHFARHPLQINEQALRSLVESGLPQTEIDAEALDQLMEAL